MANVEVLVPVESLEEGREVRRMARETNPGLTVYCTTRARKDYKGIKEGDLFVAMRTTNEAFDPACFGDPQPFYIPEHFLDLEGMLTGFGWYWCGEQPHEPVPYIEVFDDIESEPGVCCKGREPSEEAQHEELVNNRESDSKTEYCIPFAELDGPIHPKEHLVYLWVPLPDYEDFYQPKSVYRSPVGPLLIDWLGDSLRGLPFIGADPDDPWRECRQSPRALDWEYGARPLVEDPAPYEEWPLGRTVRWLDAYFDGRPLPEAPKLELEGTEQQLAVWNLLQEVPRGVTITCSELARAVQERTGRATTPSAVARAVSANPVPVIIPCHRVRNARGKCIGAGASLVRRERLALGEARGFSRSGANPAR